MAYVVCIHNHAAQYIQFWWSLSLTTSFSLDASFFSLEKTNKQEIPIVIYCDATQTVVEWEAI